MVLYSLEDFFSVPILFFKVVGLYPFHSKATVKHPKWMNFLFWFSLIDLAIGIAAEAAYFLRGLFQTQDFLKMISCATCTLFGIMGWEELFTTWRRRKLLLNIVAYLKQEFPKTPEEQERLQVTKLYRQSHALMTSFAISFVLLINAFNFLPILANTVEVYTGQGEWNSAFPFYMWFPFDPTASTPVYIIMYLFEVWAGFTAVLSCLAMNLFLGSIVTQLCLQLRMLQEDLVKAVGEEIASQGKPQHNLLEKVVRRHERIIECCKETDEIFAGSLFIVYTFSSIMLCLGLLEVVVGDRFADILKFCLLLLSSTLQTLIMSHFGQQIIDQVSSLIF